jgi:hypothetical protein
LPGERDRSKRESSQQHASEGDTAQLQVSHVLADGRPIVAVIMRPTMMVMIVIDVTARILVSTRRQTRFPRIDGQRLTQEGLAYRWLDF